MSNFVKRLVVASASLLIICLLAACAAPAPPTWRAKSAALVDELVKQDALALFPQEYRNLLETFEHGEAVLHVQGNEQEADVFYLLSLQKGSLLKGKLLLYKQRKEEVERERIAAEAVRIKEERLMREAAESEARLRDQKLRDAVLEGQAAAAKMEAYKKEYLQQQTLSYTVRRGETLPQIAARAEIYNDSSLWPLIYRANRDQIRDPKHLWPGQVLKIPRHFSRDEALEAKRYSGKK